MKDNFHKAINMVLGSIVMLGEAIMKDNGFTVRKKAKDFWTLMERHSMDNGPIIQKWESDNMFGKMEINIKDSLYLKLDRVREYISGKMDKSLKDGGKMIN
jgi:hypothetical protein